MAVIRHHVGKRLSEIAVHNGTVYLAGQIAEDADQDITGQTREVLGHIDRLLAESTAINRICCPCRSTSRTWCISPA